MQQLILVLFIGLLFDNQQRVAASDNGTAYSASSVAPPKQIPLEEEYKKHTGITPEDIKKLRDSLRSQPHLPVDYITDLDLILGYHNANRSSGVAQLVLDQSFTLKTFFTEFFKNRVVDERTDRALNSLVVTPLPKRTKEGFAVLFGGFLDTEAKNFELIDVIRAVLIIIDIWQYEEGTWPGYIILFDLKGITPEHIAKFDPSIVKKYLNFLKDGFMAHLRSLHYLNAPSFMDQFLSAVKPFLSKEILKNLHVHQPGSNTINQFYPVENLPKESGGQYKSFKELKVEVLGKLHLSQKFLEEESKKRVVETKRPGKPKTISDVL